MSLRQSTTLSAASISFVALVTGLIIALPPDLAAGADDGLNGMVTDQLLKGGATDQALHGSVQSQALQGLIKEEIVSPTRNVEPRRIDNMPVPVLPKLDLSKPQTGKAGDNNLKGKAEDQGSAKPLEATVSQEDIVPQKQNIDPDADNAELMVQWDKWRNRLLWVIQSGVDEFLSNPPPESLLWDPKANAMISRVPLGIEAWFSCQVTPSHQMQNVKLLHGSGSQLYDQAVLAAINQLQGSKILAYPPGSKRKIVTQMAGLKTTRTFQRKYFQFGDVERRQVIN